ncbi:hypothetical protein [Amycolatopsis sp. NPDC051071]|uniref:hypothetical protein n=1 Tax=Amycolatopsis sp. NPDC051071 TaxID=3154637 RepID=UPI0034249D6F
MSKHRRWAAALVAALGTLSVTTLATATDAVAAESAGFAPAEAAPSCFSLKQWDDWTVTGYRSHAEIMNNCKFLYRVRLIWNNDFDGSCKSVLAGSGFGEWRQGYVPSVSEIRLC